MQTYNKIMQGFWLAIGVVLLIIVTYMSITDGFSKWGFYYIFVALCFAVWFVRRWMMKRMVKHQNWLQEQANKKD